MRRGNSLGWIIMVLYLVLGAYFLNFTFKFIEVPEFVTSVNPWIFFVAGVLLIWGAINHKRISNRINKI